MDCLCAKFDKVSFNSFGFADRQTDRITEAADRYTHATTVGVSNYTKMTTEVAFRPQKYNNRHMLHTLLSNICFSSVTSITGTLELLIYMTQTAYNIAEIQQLS